MGEDSTTGPIDRVFEMGVLQSAAEMIADFGLSKNDLAMAMDTVSGRGYWSEARTLSNDVARECYDIVERNDVRVERDGDTAACYYLDGSGPEHITVYDLTSIRERLEEGGR